MMSVRSTLTNDVIAIMQFSLYFYHKIFNVGLAISQHYTRNYKNIAIFNLYFLISYHIKESAPECQGEPFTGTTCFFNTLK